MNASGGSLVNEELGNFSGAVAGFGWVKGLEVSLKKYCPLRVSVLSAHSHFTALRGLYLLSQLNFVLCPLLVLPTVIFSAFGWFSFSFNVITTVLIPGRRPWNCFLKTSVVRIDGVSMKLEEIDVEIKRNSENWDMHRMGGVDRNVLRLAFFELLYCTDVPPVVAVNEAVQLAKELSSEESGKFVNGILDNVIRKLDRPLRQGIPKEEV